VKKSTSVKGVGRSTWTLTLKKGTYIYRSTAHPGLKGTLKVT
jgi:plastocyanin